jgi:hypothetical protein
MAAPEAVGMRSEVLSAVAGWLDDLAGSNVHGIAVARHGRMIFQHYRSGRDECWRGSLGTVVHGPEVKHDVRSVTKVVIGLLVGHAVGRGLISDLDMPLFDVLPDYLDLRTLGKDRILLRHLLAMSAGLEWDENLPLGDPANGERRLWQARDRLRTALEPALLWEPGSVWAYSGGCTELLAAVLRVRHAGRCLRARSALRTSRHHRRRMGLPCRWHAIGLLRAADARAGPRQDRPAGDRRWPLAWRAAVARRLDRAVAHASDRHG